MFSKYMIGVSQGTYVPLNNNCNQPQSMMDIFSLRVLFCLRGSPILLRLLVQVVRTLPLISLSMVRSGSSSDTSVSPIRHRFSYCFILISVFQFLRNISLTPSCSLPSFIRIRCIFSTYRQLHTPFRISSIFHFSLPKDWVFTCLVWVMRLVPRLWMLNRLRVGDILFQVFSGYRKMDLERILLFSAGTLMTAPGLAMSIMQEKSSPRLMLLFSTMRLSSICIFWQMRVSRFWFLLLVLKNQKICSMRYTSFWASLFSFQSLAKQLAYLAMRGSTSRCQSVSWSARGKWRRSRSSMRCWTWQAQCLMTWLRSLMFSIQLYSLQIKFITNRYLNARSMPTSPSSICHSTFGYICSQHQQHPSRHPQILLLP